MAYDIVNENGGKFIDESIYRVIEEITPSTNFTLIWNNAPMKNELITPIFTEEGFCFAFNSINSHEMYTET